MASGVARHVETISDLRRVSIVHTAGAAAENDSVRQSGSTQRLGSITRMGSPQLRSILVQAGHVLLWNCKSEPPAPAAPLKTIALRVQTIHGRRKIAVVAAARHILRIAYYVGTGLSVAHRAYRGAMLRPTRASTPAHLALTRAPDRLNCPYVEAVDLSSNRAHDARA